MRPASSQTRSDVKKIAVWSTSRGQTAIHLRPGADLVLEVDPADGLRLPRGVALDDYLGSETRHAADCESHERFARWRLRRSQSLTIDGVDLTHVWEVELLARCFLPAARLLHGLPLALAATGAKQLQLRQAQDVAQLSAAIAEAIGAEVPMDHKRYVEPRYARAPVRLRPGAVAARFGVPALVRGEVLALTYWHTAPLFAELARRGKPRIVSSPLPPRDIGARLAALSARGGWTGMPGPFASASSRDEVAALLRAAPELDSGDPIDDALDRYAIAILRRLASDTLAHVRHLRRAIGRARISLALLPFDSPQQARMLLAALSGSGARTLLVQHGFAGRLGDPDMALADHLAVWSERDRSLGGDRAVDTITVTGNPGVCHLSGISPRRHMSGVTVVLVDYPGRLSTSVGERVSTEHVETALRALAAARPGSVAVVRPHPADLAPGAYAALSDCCPELTLEIDSRSSIEALLARADMCIGAVSTATLQACALGVPTVVLDVSGASRPWPFDGTSLPRAVNLDTLAEAISGALGASEIAGRDAALDALGVRPDSVAHVIDLMEHLMH